MCGFIVNFIPNQTSLAYRGRFKRILFIQYSMRNFNFKGVAILFAALVFGLPALAQSPIQLRGNQSQNLMDAQRSVYSAQRSSVHVFGPISNAPLGAAGTCDTIMFEDFQSQTIPATWLNWDIDGNTDANGLPQDWFIFNDAQTTVGIDTNWVARASSWFTPFAIANNWLIMDSFTVCDPAAVLQWQSAPFEGPGFADGYKVMVSPTGDTAMASFTDTLAVLAEDVGAGAGTWGPGWIHTTFNGTNGVLQTWVAGLAAYNGTSIRIAFVHDSDDDSSLLLDNIFAGLIVGGDMAQTTAAEGEYPIVPVNQIQPMNFSGLISNLGGTDLTNAAMNVEIFDGSMASVYTGSTVLATLTSFTDSMVSVGPFTPASAADDFTVAYYVNSASPDPNTANDTLDGFFSIDDSLYSRDDGNVSGALSIGGGAQGSPGFIGQEFDIVTTDTLSSAQFWLSSPTMGDTIHAVVIPMGALGPAGAPIATSEDLIVTDTAGALYQLDFVGGVELAAGTSYFLGLEETMTGALSLGTSGTQFTLGKGWVFFNGNWSNSEAFNFNVAYVLRAVFANATLVSIEDELRDDVSIYPVPAQNYVNVAVTSGLHSDLNVRVTDLQGRTLVTEVIPSSQDMLRLDVANFSKGIYFVEVTGENGRFVQRISVQ